MFRLLASFLLLAAAAPAQLLTYSVAIPTATAPWTRTVQLPGFDSSLGTLTAVELSLTGNVSQQVRAENTDLSATATYDLQTLVTLSAGRASSPQLFTTLPTDLHATGNLSTWDGALNYAGTSGVTVAGTFTPTGSAYDPALAAYLSASPIDFLVSSSLTKSLWSITGSSSVLSGSTTSAGALLEVRYTYASPIPEPPHVAGLLGVATLGIIFIRRRRSSPTLVA